MAANENLTTITIKIDKELKDKLKFKALKEERTMTDIIVTGIEQFIEDNKELLE